MLGRVVALAGRAVASAASSQQSAILAQQAATATSISLKQVLQARGFATNSMDVFNTHKNTPDNNLNTTFEFKPETLKRCKAIIDNYPPNYKASAVIPVLDTVQMQNEGYLTLAAMNAVAQLLEMPPIKVYEVATFYTMFNRSKIGKYHVMICGTSPCRLQGAEKIEKALTEHLNIHIGETTADGMFTLAEMECMGACVNAPMIAIADYTKGVEGFTYEYYEDLTTADAVKIVEALRKGEPLRKGSQYRKKAEPAGAIINDQWVPSKGVETLQGPPPGPYCRDLDKC